MPTNKSDNHFTRDPRTIPSRERSMSIDRTKRGLHQDSEDDESFPPAKCQAQDKTPEPKPSTSKQAKDEDGFRFQGRGYNRARRDRYEEKKTQQATAPEQPKETPTSRHQSGDVPRIIIPATEGFQSPIDVAEALEAALNMREKLPMKFLHSGQVLLFPPTMEVHDDIINLKELKGKPIHLQSSTSNITKGVVLKYHLLMPLSLLQRHPQIISADRLTHREGEPTRQVLITVRGPLPGYVDLGNWGTFYTRPYGKEPLRCFNCQRFGHHKANCTLPTKCGICAGSHETEKCIKMHKEGGTTTAKCPNCHRPHHAWNKSCTARRELVDVQKASQHQWMTRHRPSLATTNGPALAATSTWGSQPAQPHQTPNTTANADFPALGTLGTAAQQPRTGSRPRQRINASRPPTRQTEHITLSKQDLQAMFQTFATALVSMLGKQIPSEAITTLSEQVVAEVCKKRSAPQQPPSNRSSSPRPRSQSPALMPAPQTNKGITPASANIAREKAALGITQNRRSVPQQTNPATSPTQTMDMTLTLTPTTTLTQTTQETQTEKKTCKKHKDRRSKSCSGTAARYQTNTTS